MATLQATEINVAKLQELYKEDETAQALFDHFASRKRKRRVTPVTRLVSNLAAEGHSAARGSVTFVLKELEECGCGTYIVGRRGHDSRFDWTVDLRAVGMAAAGEDVGEFEDVSVDDMENDDEESDVLTHQYPLRENFSVELELPRDLTMREAERLAEHIKTLPF